MKIGHDHPFLTLCPAINEIIKPLRDTLNIVHFIYLKSYDDGRRIYLSNQVTPFKAYLDEGHYAYGYCESNPQDYVDQAALWSTLPNQHIFEFRRAHFNLSHGISFSFKNKEGYSEFMSLCGDANHPEIVNAYFNHFDFIKKFRSVFLKKAENIIEQLEPHALTLPHKNETPPLFRQANTSSLKKGTMKVEHHELNCHVILSKQQSQCFRLLLEGKTAKNISVILKLSPRTVEEYIKIIRLKLNARSSKELIAKYIR
ncbi:MAG: helix-turn-helix transcriptional regulator [Gammaproteobacteria bacterium]|nr:helix-turn-helix transcriptional regulator [Gammaproteobacteria bacterium]